jgi:hypothetical protein
MLCFANSLQPAGELMILLCLLKQQKEKKYGISLRQTESPIEAKKLTPWLLPTHHPQASASFPRVRPSLNAQPRNSELAPNAGLALGERASEPKELRAHSQRWTCSGPASERAKRTPSSLPMLDLLWASERQERERGSNDDSAADARVRLRNVLATTTYYGRNLLYI